MSQYKRSEEHSLIIESLRDGKARCSCGKWALVQTGLICYKDLFSAFDKHIEPVTKKGPGPANCVTGEELTDVDLTVNRFILG